MAQTANVVGAVLFAVPAAQIEERRGRRPSLAAGYAFAAVVALLVVAPSMRDSVALLFAGLFLFGCGSAVGYQARYAAVHLATDALGGGISHSSCGPPRWARSSARASRHPLARR